MSRSVRVASVDFCASWFKQPAQHVTKPRWMTNLRALIRAARGGVWQPVRTAMAEYGDRKLGRVLRDPLHEQAGSASMYAFCTQRQETYL